MEILYLNIAGFNLKVTFGKTSLPAEQHEFSSLINHFYQGFVTKDIPRRIDYYITVSYNGSFEILEHSDYTRLLLFYKERGRKYIDTYYYISLKQFSFILKQILLKLLANRGFIIHASAAIGKKGAYVFTGKSGSGKSTIVKLIKHRYRVVADDSIIIKKEGGSFYLYSTPFIEKEGWFERSSAKYPLAGVFFLRKTPYFAREKLADSSIALERMSRELWLPGPSAIKQQMTVFIDFATRFKNVYNLCFSKQKKVADYIEG